MAVLPASSCSDLRVEMGSYTTFFAFSLSLAVISSYAMASETVN